MNNCLVTKLDAVVDNDQLPVFLAYTEAIIPGSITPNTYREFVFAKGTEIEREEIHFILECPVGAVLNYAVLNETGSTLRLGDDSRGYYIYSPNIEYTIPKNELNTGTLSSSQNVRGYVNNSGALQAATATFKVWYVRK